MKKIPSLIFHEFHSDNVILPREHEETIGRFILEKRVGKELKAGRTQETYFVKTVTKLITIQIIIYKSYDGSIKNIRCYTTIRNNKIYCKVR